MDNRQSYRISINVLLKNRYGWIYTHLCHLITGAGHLDHGQGIWGGWQALALLKGLLTYVIVKCIKTRQPATKFW